MKDLNPFHLAIQAENIDICRLFYRDTLGCHEGRSEPKWVDFNFFGHQLVIHQTQRSTDWQATNSVDGHNVPIPHFGVVLDLDQWESLAERLRCKGVEFIIDPHVRFPGKIGEQATMFFKDPDGNSLEFKAFKNIDQLFSKKVS